MTQSFYFAWIICGLAVVGVVWRRTSNIDGQYRRAFIRAGVISLVFGFGGISGHGAAQSFPLWYLIFSNWRGGAIFILGIVVWWIVIYLMYALILLVLGKLLQR